MKFGLFMLPSWPEPDPKHQSRILGEMMEQIEFAEELGYDSVWLAEHHFTRYGIVPSAVAMGLYAAGRTKRIRIGTGVSVLTFQNPVFIAEETAMLDALSNGRLDFGVGRGQVVYEYGNLKVDYNTRSERFSEILDVILGLWKHPGFSYHGDFYNVEDMTIAPVPVQEPHPPVFLAVSRTPESVSVAVDRGLPVLTSAKHHRRRGAGNPQCVFSGVRRERRRAAVGRYALFPQGLRGGGRKVVHRGPARGRNVGVRPERLPSHPEGRQRNLLQPGPVD